MSKAMSDNEGKLRAALKEIADECVCRCDVAWTSRKLHQTDCTQWIGDIAREALADQHGEPATPSTPKLWRCQECKRDNIAEDELIMDNGVSFEGVPGHLVRGGGWPHWCGPVVESND